MSHKWWNNEQIASTMTARNAGGGQRMPDKDNFMCVLADVKEVNNYSCFDCVHRNIRETSHEWIENFCKLQDGQTNNPFDGCINYERGE